MLWSGSPAVGMKHREKETETSTIIHTRKPSVAILDDSKRVWCTVTVCVLRSTRLGFLVAV